MGNKVARTVTFFYTILLHSLVFLVSMCGVNFTLLLFLVSVFCILPSSALSRLPGEYVWCKFYSSFTLLLFLVSVLCILHSSALSHLPGDSLSSQ